MQKVLGYGKYIIMLCLFSATGYTLLYFTYENVKTKLIANLNERQLVHGQQASRGITDFFENWTTTLTAYSNIEDIIELNDEGKRLMTVLYETRRDQIKAVTRVDARGRIVYTIPASPEAVGRDISPQKHIKEIMRTHRPVISDVFWAVQGFETVALHIPVFRNKTYQGTIGIAINFSTLSERYLENIKIGEDGEILIKGPQVMKGYYKNEEATKEAFTSDGFFRTGDIGEIDKDGYLKITGRIKDLIVTSGGKNISPQNIENTLVTSAFIEQVAIIGDNRKYLSALIVPSFATLESWAKDKGISFSERADLIKNPEVIKLFEHEIEENMKDYARVEQIRKFTLLEKEWSQDTGELTPTMKVKRKVINQKYASVIESLYPPE